MVTLTPREIEQFRADGFIVLERFLSAQEVERARTRFEPFFRGEFETGLYPDEWNWCEGRDPLPVGVPARGCAIHAVGTWHGSGTNCTHQPRRSLVTHCIAAEARFHPTEVSYIYSRYHRVGDDTMDESFFPILWTQSGYRSAYLEAYCHGAGN